MFSTPKTPWNENWKSNSFCEQIITVVDETAPTMTVEWPADREELLGPEACEADLSLDLVTARRQTIATAT